MLDTICILHELVPMSMGIPQVQIWNVLHLDFSGLTPVGLLSWPHDTTREALERDVEVLQQVGAMFAPMIAEPARRAGCYSTRTAAVGSRVHAPRTPRADAGDRSLLRFRVTRPMIRPAGVPLDGTDVRLPLERSENAVRP